MIFRQKIKSKLVKILSMTVLSSCVAACGGSSSTAQIQTELTSPTLSQVRSNKSLNQAQWRFILDDQKLDVEAAQKVLTDSGESVQLPHTWNANDAATTSGTTAYHRGVGWYQLEFEDNGESSANTWLQFDGASVVADVWLNGQKLGTHGGAFTSFRFNVSKLLKKGKNVLIVKCDNTKAAKGSDPTAIAPLGGDFNMAGGLYRGVSLISTPKSTSIALNDFGSSGVYVSTTAIDNVHSEGDQAFGNAYLNVKTKVSHPSGSEDEYRIRTSLVDDSEKIVATQLTAHKFQVAGDIDIQQQLILSNAHLWNGVEDPYLYHVIVELIDGSGNIIDKSIQQYGIRDIKIDPDEGFYLNGKSYRLNGVNVHQDALGKAWAVSDQDVDERMNTVLDIGGNAVRFAHYPYSQYAYSKADQLGLIVWSEAPFVNQSLTGSQGKAGLISGDCLTTSIVPTSFIDNLEQQTKEMVRQNYNHTSIGMWSIANEVNTIGICQGVDTVTPIVHRLNDLVHKEDPYRPTTLADMAQDRFEYFPAFSRIGEAGITDVIGYNRYFGWYDNVLELMNDLTTHLDELHNRFPDQPMALSEYGAGAAISHHSDNPLGGPTNNFDLSGGTKVNYQTEEYASFVHEQNYAILQSKNYLWGSFIWNLFDFGSGTRNEGDVRGVNTKGLITFDHQIKKDPYYFYQASWRKDIPVVHITGRRYTNRAYSVADIKVYSNTDSTTLTLNGQVYQSMSREQCKYTSKEIANASTVNNTCVFKAVPLKVGSNIISATGSRNGQPTSDSVIWYLDAGQAKQVNIATGQITSGLREESTGSKFGSDNFFEGGVGRNLFPLGSTDTNQDQTVVSGLSNSGDAPIWQSYRTGLSFSYQIPLEKGSYHVTLGFLEPAATRKVGERVFNVLANNQLIYSKIDPLAQTGKYRTAVSKSFDVDITNGVLRLDFQSITGQAVVSNIKVTRN